MAGSVRVQVGSARGAGQKSERVVTIVMAAFFAVMLLVGTFLDEAIARALYSPHNVVATIVTTLGIYPFFSPLVLFMGVVCERVAHTGLAKPLRIVAQVACLVVALLVGFVGATHIVDADCLGGVWPHLTKNYPVIALLSLTVEWPLFLLGWRLSVGSTDKKLLKRVLLLIAVFLAAYAFMQVAKGVFNRPRYRVVVEGLAGIDFVPWYTISPKPTDLIEAYGLAKNEFTSFPSGHAILSTVVTSILLSLTWFFPSLRDKRVQLRWAGFAFAVVVMFTRMVLGAHFLSDVSAGGLIGLVFLLVFDAVEASVPDGDASAR